MQAAWSALLPCPPTRWDTTAVVKPSVRNVPFLRTVVAPADATSQVSWMQDHSDELMATLASCGAIHFRGFELPKTQEGFRQFVGALPLQVCEDPLSSIGVRSLLSRSDGVYEAVDAQPLADTPIGLHNDATLKLAAPLAAFACFRKASSGGAFLVADGQAILRALPPELLQNLCRRKLRVRVAAFPIGKLLGPQSVPLCATLRRVVASALKSALDLAIPLDLDVVWSSDGQVLQLCEQPKSPVNRHPLTGEFTFFSGIHSQSRYLQEHRAGRTFEGVASTDVFFGDGEASDEAIEPAALEQINDVIAEHTRPILMEPGDVVLLESYSVLHGRDTFVGRRQHGVLWLTSPAYEDDVDHAEPVSADGVVLGTTHGTTWSWGAVSTSVSSLVKRLLVKK
jgi:hypothetical protein